MVRLAIVLLMAIPGLSVPARAGVRSSADEPGSTVYYIMTSNGDSLYVRGSISTTKDIAQRYVLSGYGNGAIDPGPAWIVNPASANTLSAYRAGELMADGNLNAALIWTNNAGLLLGSHGLELPRVTSIGHDKTSADIGSRWTDGTSRWIIAATDSSGGHITFYYPPQGPAFSGNSWVMPTSVAGTLMHVAGATHTGNVTVTSQTTTMVYPVVSGRTVTATTAGGQTLAASDEGRSSYVDLVESYDLVDPSTVDTTAKPFVWNDGLTWMTVTNAYRCYPGRTELNVRYVTARGMSMKMLHYTMQAPITSAAHEHRYYWLPGTKCWSDPVQLDCSPAKGCLFTVDSVDRTPVHQLLTWKKTGFNQYDIGLAIGRSPIADSPTAANATVYFYINEVGKLYPNFYGSSAFSAPKTFDIHAYRQWFDPTCYPPGKVVYWNTASSTGDELIYIDYHAAATNDTTALPARMVGKAVSVVDSLNVTIGECVAAPYGVTVSTTPGDTVGYAVLRLSTLNVQVDDPPSAGGLGPPVPNPSDGPVRVSYAIATTGRVRLDVFDLGGRVVRRLVDEEQRAGVRTAVWNGTDESGARPRAGVYFVRLAGPGALVTRKVVLVR